MNKVKISQKESKLLFSMLFLLILVVSYQFVYVKNVEKLEVIETEITTLKERVDTLKQQVANKDTMIQEIDQMKQETIDLVSTYGKGTTIEKTILFTKDMEDLASMKIDSLNVSQDSYFLSQTIPTDNKYVSGTNEVNKGYTLTEGTEVIDHNVLTGYRTDAAINFTVTYDNLKRVLNYIHQHEEKRNISDISLAYDSETGNLKGTMNIAMYHILGNKDSYEMPSIRRNNLGTRNIFGTIELP